MQDTKITGGSQTSLASTDTPRQTASTDQLAVRLLEILRAILAERSTGTAPTEQLTVHTNWRDLGINSVDFLSFVLAVEKEFSVELPEEDLGGDALVSVDAWSKYLATRRAG